MDFDVSNNQTRACACGCGRSLASHRPQAKYYDAACRKTAHLERNRSVLGDRTVSLAGEEGYFDAIDATRGYLHNWQPKRATQIMLARTKAIIEEFDKYLPLTCRQIYYRMIAEFHYPKGDKFEAKLYGMLNDARRAREIPFDSIRDDGIMGGGSWPSGPEDVLDQWRLEAGNYSSDVQLGQPRRVQVWCESAGMIPQLTRVADRYSVPVYSCGGFNSLTAVRQIVHSCIYDTKGETVFLHLGDCDPSGYSIYQAVVEDVAAFVEEDRIHEEQKFTYERVAITFDQVKEYGLTSDEIRTKDSRSKAWLARGLTHKTEIEALPPDAIADLLAQAIERHVDIDLIDQRRENEHPERRALQDVMELADAHTKLLLAGERLGRLLSVAS